MVEDIFKYAIELVDIEKTYTLHSANEVVTSIMNQAENTLVTKPRRLTNHRLATAAPNTKAKHPVPNPTKSPQRTTKCQLWVISVVRYKPEATRSNAEATTRRIEKRSIKVAAKGAVMPYISKWSATAPEVTLRDQPNSSSSGTNMTPVVDLNAAAEISVRKVIATIHQARCMRETAVNML